jgi:hypothetical protein
MTGTKPVMIFRDTIHPEQLALPDPSYDGVFYYVNGAISEWPAEQVQRFKSAGKRLHAIDVIGDAPGLADILDVEKGAATVAQVPAWIEERWKTHSTAGVYCSRSKVPAIVSVLDGLPSYLIVADWLPSMQPHIPALALPRNIVLAGVQYASYTDYDLTAIYSRAWLEGVRI